MRRDDDAVGRACSTGRIAVPILPVRL